MADMSRIVAAVIAITVSADRAEPYCGVCYCAGQRACSYDSRIHRRRWSSRRVHSDPWGSHADGNRWYPYGCCPPDHQQELMA